MLHLDRAGCGQRRDPGQRQKRFARKGGVGAAQAAHNVGQGFAREMALDLRQQGGQAARRRGLGKRREGGDPCAGKGCRQGGPVGFGHEMIGKAREDRITWAHPAAGGGKVFAQSPRRARQQKTAADIGHQADSAFRQGDLRRRGDYAVAGMAPHPDPAAHGKALHQADHRLGVRRNPGVHAVFVAPELLAVGKVAGLGFGVKLGDVAPGAEGARAGGINQHQRHAIVLLPVAQGSIQRAAHRVGQGVKHLGAVERDLAEQTGAADQDVRHHAPAPRAR